MSTLQVLVISLLIAVSATDGAQLSRRDFVNWKALRALVRNSVLNAPPTCVKAIDVGIVMDRSLRDTTPGWDDVMLFAMKLVNEFYISDDMTRIGAILFDETAEVLLTFDEFYDVEGSVYEAVYKQMNTWQPGSHGENTVIDQALQLALTDLFLGARQYQEVLVLLTYGGQNSDAAAAVARKLEEEKFVKVFVVGFGDPDPKELFKIAGGLKDTSKAKNVFYVSGPDEVNTVAKQVAQAACQD